MDLFVMSMFAGGNVSVQVPPARRSDFGKFGCFCAVFDVKIFFLYFTFDKANYLLYPIFRRPLE